MRHLTLVQAEHLVYSVLIFVSTRRYYYTRRISNLIILFGRCRYGTIWAASMIRQVHSISDCQAKDLDRDGTKAYRVASIPADARYELVRVRQAELVRNTETLSHDQAQRFLSLRSSTWYRRIAGYENIALVPHVPASKEALSQHDSRHNLGSGHFGCSRRWFPSFLSTTGSRKVYAQPSIPPLK